MTPTHDSGKSIPLEEARGHYLSLLSAVFVLFADRPPMELHAFFKKAVHLKAITDLNLCLDEKFFNKIVEMHSVLHPRDGIYPNPPDCCRHCGGALVRENRRSPDGCTCSPPAGVNHGLVPRNTCLCAECDPDKTGSVRLPPPGAS